MRKSFIITFSISVIVFATAAVVMLMLLLPKQLISIKTSVEKYQSIEKANYTYTKTKDISKEALLKEYKVSYTDMDVYKNEYKYRPGNSDPFYRYVEDTSTKTTNTNTNNSSSSSTSSSSTSSSSNLTAEQKTTNSNGGIANPASTTK